MALISKEKSIYKEKIKLEIREDIINEIKDYCQWSGVDDISVFLEEAALFIFKKDSDWKKYKKSQKTS